jgi:hypothetical protein
MDLAAAGPKSRHVMTLEFLMEFQGKKKIGAKIQDPTTRNCSQPFCLFKIKLWVQTWKRNILARIHLKYLYV